MSDSLFQKFGKKFKGNEIIFCEHESGDDFYVIRSGKVKLTKIVDSKEKIIDVLSESDFFGEMAILEEAPRSATAIAYDGNVECLNFNKANFEALLSGQPQMAIRLLQSFSKRIFEAKRRLKTLRLSDIELKVVDTLLMIAEQKGISFQADSNQVELEADADQIASWSAVKLNKTKEILHRYQNMGKISIKDGRIILQDPQDLSRLIISKMKTK